MGKGNKGLGGKTQADGWAYGMVAVYIAKEKDLAKTIS